MKPTSFTLDKRLYELLQDEGLTQFTTATLRDAYASRLGGTPYRLGEVRRYVYEQIRRMLRAGWLVLDDERRKRGQVYHLLPMPEHMQLKLIGNGFEKSLKPEHKTKRTSPESSQSLAASGTEAEVYHRLEATLKEVRLDFLTSMGETERYKLLLDEMPHLRSHVEHEYQEAKDRSSRLLGHLRAVEKTLTALPSQ
ncbi:MAG: hypothetical protein ACQEUM_17620 [Pseudomonadota bacterium]